MDRLAYRSFLLRCTEIMTSALPSTAARIIDEKMKPLSNRSDTSTQLSSNGSPASNTLLMLVFVFPVRLPATVENSSRAVAGENGSAEDAPVADEVDDAVNDSEVNEASTNRVVVCKVVVDGLIVVVVVVVAVVVVAAAAAAVSSKLLLLPLVMPAVVVAAAPPAASIAIDLLGLRVAEVGNAAAVMAVLGLCAALGVDIISTHCCAD